MTVFEKTRATSTSVALRDQDRVGPQSQPAIRSGANATTTRIAILRRSSTTQRHDAGHQREHHQDQDQCVGGEGAGVPHPAELVGETCHLVAEVRTGDRDHPVSEPVVKRHQELSEQHVDEPADRGHAKSRLSPSPTPASRDGSKRRSGR